MPIDPHDKGSLRQRNWREALTVYAHPRVGGMLFLGFSSGLPFLLVFSTLSAWMAMAGVNLSSIGFFSLAMLSYSLKFFWAPVVDRLPLPLLTRLLGRRRGWLLLAQFAVAAGLFGIANTDPLTQMSRLVWLAVGTAFAGATQDICIDAWRIEAVGIERQGAMAAVYQFGYRIAMLMAGAGALFIAAEKGWHLAYLVMAALMLVGIITTLLVPEPDAEPTRAAWREEQRVVDFVTRNAHWPQTLRDVVGWIIGAVVCPFVDFFQRNGKQLAVLILAFVCFYRLAYLTMGVMANPFYLHLGFSLEQIATVSKIFGVIMTMIGAAVGGWMVARYGLLRTLMVGLLMVAAANVYFAAMTALPHHTWSLATAITIDNLGAGIEGTAFIAYLSSLTSTSYTATQYALFSSIYSLPGHAIGGFSGVIVEHLGYPLFFLYTAALTVPALALLLYLMRRRAGVTAG